MTTSKQTAPAIIQIPAFNDNYLWLISDNGQAYVVDPGDAEPIEAALKQHNLDLSGILITHHHWDHTNGINALLEQRDIPVYGPQSDKIPQVSHPVKEGDQLKLTEHLAFTVLEVPGHTLDHIAYFGHGYLFCGDTLFSAGCGRLFEGSAEQMYSSLEKLSRLPPDTLIYCAHEYTTANLKFAAAVEPNNPAIQSHIHKVDKLRADGLSSLPSTIGLEQKINPFLRAHHPDVIQAAQQRAGSPLSADSAILAEIRRWKDNF